MEAAAANQLAQAAVFLQARAVDFLQVQVVDFLQAPVADFPLGPVVDFQRVLAGVCRQALANNLKPFTASRPSHIGGAFCFQASAIDVNATAQ